MCNIRKIFGVMFLLVCMILPQSVFAEKHDYKDKDFSFRGIRRVVIMNLSSDTDLHIKGNVFVQKIRNSYYDNARKLKCEIITEDQARQMTGSSDPRAISQIADAWIQCNIKDLSDDYYIVPERTTWEQKKMYRTVRDRDGRTYEESYYITVPVTHPPYRVDVSKISVTFEVYDARSGKMIFGRDDVRDREDKDAQDGMFGRICNSFFQDFGKLIK